MDPHEIGSHLLARLGPPGPLVPPASKLLHQTDHTAYAALDLTEFHMLPLPL